jgi:uncharacterized protein YutE (UPF0331/DUF86 family)
MKNTDLNLQRINEKTAFALSNLENLKKLRNIPEDEFYSDFRNIESAKHLLQVSIEAMIDIANHIIARKKLDRPESYSHSFKILNERGIISDDKLENLMIMAKFRNRVVHIYNNLDPKEIYRILNQNLADFGFYLEEIRLYLKNEYK